MRVRESALALPAAIRPVSVNKHRVAFASLYLSSKVLYKVYFAFALISFMEKWIFGRLYSPPMQVEILPILKPDIYINTLD